MPQIPATITGNLTADVRLKQLPGGARVARMRVAASRSYRNDAGNWQTADNLFITVDCWGQLADNVRTSLAKGMPVIVVGTLITNEWPNPVGEIQQQILLKASHVGLDLNRHIVSSAKKDPGSSKVVPGVDAPDATGEAPVDEVVAPRQDLEHAVVGPETAGAALSDAEEEGSGGEGQELVGAGASPAGVAAEEAGEAPF